MSVLYSIEYKELDKRVAAQEKEMQERIAASTRVSIAQEKLESRFNRMSADVLDLQQREKRVEKSKAKEQKVVEDIKNQQKEAVEIARTVPELQAKLQRLEERLNGLEAASGGTGVQKNAATAKSGTNSSGIDTAGTKGMAGEVAHIDSETEDEL